MLNVLVKNKEQNQELKQTDRLYEKFFAVRTSDHLVYRNSGKVTLTKYTGTPKDKKTIKVKL